MKETFDWDEEIVGHEDFTADSDSEEDEDKEQKTTERRTFGRGYRSNNE